MEELIIRKDLWLAMAGHAEDSLPEECCGLAAGQNLTVQEIAPVENSLHSAVEFRMDARSQIREILRIEERGLDLLAIYHSHPNGPETPSQKDINMFMYPESYSIILSRKNGIWGGRGFRITNQTVSEILVVIR